MSTDTNNNGDDVDYGYDKAQKIYSSIIDVILDEKNDNLEWLCVNKTFSFQNISYPKDQLLEIIPSRCFGDNKTAKSGLDVVVYPSGKKVKLPCYIEGYFTKCQNPNFILSASTCLECDDEKVDNTLNGKIEHTLKDFDDDTSYISDDGTSCSTTSECSEKGYIVSDYITMQSLAQDTLNTNEQENQYEKMDVNIKRKIFATKFRKNYSTGEITENVTPQRSKSKPSPGRYAWSDSGINTNNKIIHETTDSLGSANRIKHFNTNEVCNLFKLLCFDMHTSDIQNKRIDGNMLVKYTENELQTVLKLSILEARILFSYIHKGWRLLNNISQDNQTRKKRFCYSITEVQSDLLLYGFDALALFLSRYKVDGKMLELIVQDDLLLKLKLPDGSQIDRDDLKYLQVQYKNDWRKNRTMSLA